MAGWSRNRAVAACAMMIAAVPAWVVVSHRRSPRDPLASLPPVVIWAWERPEDLRFLNPAEAVVAYLDRTIVLRGEAVEVRPRLQPLRLPPGAMVIAVARVESQSPMLSPAQQSDVVSALAQMAQPAGLSGIQVDFDAAVSERQFYRSILEDLRRRLPRRFLLSVTALASWCLDDDWIAGLPVDEAVPMLFRMGPDDRRIRTLLRAGRDFTDEACRHSAGVSTDEPLPPLRRSRRTYVFHPGPWTQPAWETIVRRVKSWQ
jgi:Protein of unknown function (DUF3142)